MKRLNWFQRVLRALYMRYVVAKYYPIHCTFGRRWTGKALPDPHVAFLFSVNPIGSVADPDESAGILFWLALSDEQVRSLIENGQKLLAASR